MKPLLLCALLLLPVSAFAQETDMRGHVDDCYVSATTLECYGWSVGNGFTPQFAVMVGTCDPWMCVGSAVDAAVDLDARPDVCAVVESWDWTCNDGLTPPGRHAVVDISSLPTGWYWVVLWSYVTAYPEDPVGEWSNAVWIYVE
jgi:hypothetical protein